MTQFLKKDIFRLQAVWAGFTIKISLKRNIQLALLVIGFIYVKAYLLFVEKSQDNNEGKITADFRKSTFLIASYQQSMILLADL